MTDNPTANDIALLREALSEQRMWHESAAKSLSKQPQTSDTRWRRAEHQEQIDAIDAALAPGQHDGAAGEGQRELEYFNRTTCACTAAGAYVPDCDKHGAKPLTEQARAEGIMCGGCGETDSSKRCMGCLHDFGTPESAWVKDYRL